MRHPYRYKEAVTYTFSFTVSYSIRYQLVFGDSEADSL